MNPDYREYHPRWYRPKVPIFWWLRQRVYAKFIGRELTSVLVAYAAIMLLVLVVAIDRGEAAYAQLTGWLSRPLVVTLHVVVLMGALFHTITWLNLAPMALVAKVGGKRVPDVAVLVGHYVAWAACTVLVVWALVWR